MIKKTTASGIAKAIKGTLSMPKKKSNMKRQTFGLLPCSIFSKQYRNAGHPRQYSTIAKGSNAHITVPITI